MKKSSKKKIGIFFLIILAIGIVFSIYQFLLRPILKKSMVTEVMGMGITFILSASLVIVLLSILVLALYLIILKVEKAKNTRKWKRYTKNFILGLIIIILLLGGFTYYSQINAYTKPICNEYNDIIPTSISKLEKVKLGGDEEWISVRGKDKSNPLLLVLSDGPGKSEMAMFNKSLERLEDNFVVVNWDELGAGKSYKSVDELNMEKYTSDGVELTRYLCEKYNKNKVYLLGNSFGSALGMLMVKNSPNLYEGFIGTSQIVSVKRNEEYKYNKAFEIADNSDDEKEIRKLKAQGNPPYDKDFYNKQKVYSDYLKRKENENNKINSDGENKFSSIFSSEYGLLDKVNMVYAEKKTYNKIFKSYYSIDLMNSANNVEVPVYFFQGRLDNLSSADILNEYVGSLNAPNKEIIWFENSGSKPWSSENNEFINKINQKFSNK